MTTILQAAAAAAAILAIGGAIVYGVLKAIEALGALDWEDGQ